MNAPAVLSPEQARFTDKAEVVVVGAGACGLCAALAARDGGADVLLIERDAVPRGTTAMSIGLIPAANTRFQRDRGIADSVENFVADILKRNEGKTDVARVHHIVRESAPTVEWLVDKHEVPLSLQNELYAGHSLYRMHGTVGCTGGEVMDGLYAAANKVGVRFALNTIVETLFADATGKIAGVRVVSKGAQRDIACGALILASSGFAANREMVTKHIPAMAKAGTYCHHGAQGDAVRWGEALGAAFGDITAYQSHGGLMVDRPASVPWAHILRGGIQVNATGKRFSDETANYAERAHDILAQPDGFAWSIFDQQIEDSLANFMPYVDFLKIGKVITANSAEDLVAVTGLPPTLIDTLREVADVAAGKIKDPLGRNFRDAKPLTAPFKAVKVTGSLYHTQGGLEVDEQGRALRADRNPFPNLFAGGGAARGISGPGCAGYLGGNGLLTASVYGRLAGTAAAAQVHPDGRNA